MNIILIGPQASGKGTQAKKIAEEYDMKHFSTGDALRTEVTSGSALGQKVKAIMDSGELVPVEVVNDIIKGAVKQYEEQGLIFDGYPRTIEQADFLKTITKIDALVAIEVSDDEAVKRISTRYFCPECQRGYNSITQPPKVPGKCDDDNANLIQRDDDKPESVRKRLADYHEKTSPIIDYFEKIGVKIHKINGEQPIEDVFSDIKAALDQER